MLSLVDGARGRTTWQISSRQVVCFAPVLVHCCNRGVLKGLWETVAELPMFHQRLFDGTTWAVVRKNWTETGCTKVVCFGFDYRTVWEDVRPYIFEPFFSTKDGTGTGLGLWVSESIAQAWGEDRGHQSDPRRSESTHDVPGHASERCPGELDGIESVARCCGGRPTLGAVRRRAEGGAPNFVPTGNLL